jgi:hypothetical protein
MIVEKNEKKCWNCDNYVRNVKVDMGVCIIAKKGKSPFRYNDSECAKFIKRSDYVEMENILFEITEREKLEQMWRDDELFFTDYDDMDLYTESFEIGSKAWKVNKEENAETEIDEMKLVHMYSRNNDTEWYDDICENDEFIDVYNGEYDVSGEFILDNDCVYCYFEYVY